MKDNLVRAFERIVKPIVIIAAFLLVLLWGFYNEAKAGEVSVELGPTFLSGQLSEGAALLLTERFGKYSVGIGYLSEQWVEPRNQPRTFVMEAAVIQVYRNVDIAGKFSLGLGAAYVNMDKKESRALGCPVQFVLRVQYRFARHWSGNIGHLSSAGSCRPNMGQDMLTVGYHF